MSRNSGFDSEMDDGLDNDESLECGAFAGKVSGSNGMASSSPVKRGPKHRVESMPSDEEVARKQWAGSSKSKPIYFLAASCEDPDDIDLFTCRRRYRWLRVGGLTPKNFEDIPAALGPIAVNRKVVYVVGSNATRFLEIMKSIHDGSRVGSPGYVDFMILIRECFAAGMAHGEKIAKKSSKP